MRFTPIFRNPALQAFLGGTGETIRVPGLPFTWQHSAELGSGQEGPERRDDVLRGHLAGPPRPGAGPPETPAPPLCPQRPRPGADFAGRALALPTMHRILAGPPYGWAQLLLGTKTPSETHKAPADTP